VEVGREQLQPLAEATDTGDRGLAPRAVLMALLGLLRGRETHAVCATVIADDNATKWQVAAITDRHASVVKASRNITGWALGNGDDEARDEIELTAWAVPIDTLTSAAVLEVRDDTRRDFAPTVWAFSAFSAVYRFRFGESEFTLPVSGKPGTHAEVERVEKFVTQLLNPERPTG
jgi:hypothetical protein